MLGLLRWLIWLGGAVFVLTFIAVAIAAAWMENRHGQGRSLGEPVDITIVLSAGIDPDGQLSYPTRRRVYAAVKLLQSGQTKRLLLSGGMIGEGLPALADRMKDLALSLGATPAAVSVENRSQTTLQNIRFSVPMARADGPARIALLTDHYHLLRADMLSWAVMGERFALISARGMEQENWMNQARQIGREAMAWWYNLGKMAVWHGMAYAGYPEAERAKVVR